MNNVIEFKNIKKAYEDKVVISDFNLSIEKGEFVTIIGSSGCGKTTILKMINGLIESTSGDIFIDGETIKNKNLCSLIPPKAVPENRDFFQQNFFLAFRSSTENHTHAARNTRIIMILTAFPKSISRSLIIP